MSDPSANQPAGPAVDAVGRTAVDPTANVLAVVEAATRRLDDLRIAEMVHRAEMTKYRDDCTAEREELNRELRKAESSRIDAIRAVDVGAVARAAEVSAAQQQVLAAQVAASAEAMRAQVAATATAAATNLVAALEPIQRDIADLRKTQYEQAGQRAQQVDSRGSSQWAIGFALSAAVALLSLAGLIVVLVAR